MKTTQHSEAAAVIVTCLAAAPAEEVASLFVDIQAGTAAGGRLTSIGKQGRLEFDVDAEPIGLVFTVTAPEVTTTVSAVINGPTHIAQGVCFGPEMERLMPILATWCARIASPQDWPAIRSLLHNPRF